jgi:hypothetical protein
MITARLADLVGYTLAALSPAVAPELDDLRACAWLTELADTR